MPDVSLIWGFAWGMFDGLFFLVVAVTFGRLVWWVTEKVVD